MFRCSDTQKTVGYSVFLQILIEYIFLLQIFFHASKLPKWANAVPISTNINGHHTPILFFDGYCSLAAICETNGFLHV